MFTEFHRKNFYWKLSGFIAKGSFVATVGFSLGDLMVWCLV
jgi:hypothetical protein